MTATCRLAPDALHDALDQLVASMAVTDLWHGAITLAWPATPPGLTAILTLDLALVP